MTVFMATQQTSTAKHPHSTLHSNPPPATGSSTKPTLFSGIQPSGQLTLGTYLGALRPWVHLQHQFDCLFCIVDLHAITVRQDPAALRERCYECAAVYIAAGIDPTTSTIFIQSQVPEHSELAWILSCHTSMGELSRMTQYKDKSAKQKTIGTGLLTYPTLMAADILLYQTALVPVGEDQRQHLELTRDLAERMNAAYPSAADPTPLFKVPDPYFAAVGAKIMSLVDPQQKMSKSDPIPNATVFLADSDDLIRKKIKRATTDSGTEITDSPEKPGVRNLLVIQAALTGKKIEDLVAAYAGKQYGHLKIDTGDIVADALGPIREMTQRLLSDRAHLDQILARGAAQARAQATITLKRVKEALGFIC